MRITCDNCRGRGWGLIADPVPGGYVERKIDCEVCEGGGTVRFAPPRNTWYVFNRWPTDVRKRRRAHRRAALALVRGGTFLNPGRAPRGSIPGSVAAWHLNCARFLR